MRTFPSLLAFGLVLAGCGGGGGSGPRRGTGLVTVFTDLTGLPSGARLRYALTTFDGRQDGRTVASQTVAPGGATTRVDLEGLPSGTLHLHGALTGAAGEDLGTVDTLVDGAIASALTVVRNAPAAALTVQPAAALLRPGETRRLFATAKTDDGRLILAPSGGVAWSSGGAGVATVDDGLVTGVAEGTAAIAATAGTVPAVSTPATVVSAAPKKWTVLIYMNAANDLAPFSRANMEQIENLGDNPDVRFVVQWKTRPEDDSGALFQGTRRYLARRDDAAGIGSALLQDLGMGVDMGRPGTLADFVAWGRANFPAERTALVVWNHGNGWQRNQTPGGVAPRSVSEDGEFHSEIQTWELPAALGGARLDALIWDASLMQMLEVAYDLRSRVDYVVGSEESPPGQGLIYNAGFAAFHDTPDLPTLDLLKPLVDRTVGAPEYLDSKVTESILDASKLEGLATAVDGLGRALIENRASLTTLVPEVRNTAQSYAHSGKTYLDLYDVADLLGTRAPFLADAAQAVKAAVGAAVVYEGHTALSPRSHGVSIDFSSGTSFAAVRADYARTGLAQRTRWDDWLTMAP